MNPGGKMIWDMGKQHRSLNYWGGDGGGANYREAKWYRGQNHTEGQNDTGHG